jgi:CDP-paratose synthetase
MKILLTGGTGYLGSYLLQKMILLGHDVTVIKRSGSDLSRVQSFLESCKFIDVDNDGWPTIFNENSFYDMVIHAATSYGRQENDLEVFNSNLLFAITLLYYSRLYKVKKFINLDTALAKNTNAYSLSKKQFVEWGQFYAATNGINFLNVILEHFFGPHEDKSKFISHIISKCLNNEDIPLTVGEQKRDFLFVEDMVDAIMLTLQMPLNDSFTEIEIGSGEAISINEIVEKIYRLTGSKSQLLFGQLPYRKNEVMLSVADTKKLKELGWIARRNLDEALEYTIQEEKKI